MSRIQADAVALAVDNVACCCESAPNAKGIGRKAPREGFFSIPLRIYHAGANRLLFPCFDLGADMRKGSWEQRVAAAFLVLVAIGLGVFLGFALWGGRRT